jgi:type IV secretion system protein VirB8
MSAPAVHLDFQKLYEGSEARDRTLSNKARIEVAVRSIQPTAKGQASVRFSTQKVDAGSGVKEAARHWIAAVAYVYAAAPMRAEDRRINPLGFQVTSYRADPESVAAEEAKP